MSLEIRELQIKAVINDSPGGEEDSSQRGSVSSSSASDKGQIVRECVEEVLKILRDKSER